jgi:polysaccharide export outer membrane protein
MYLANAQQKVVRTATCRMREGPTFGIMGEVRDAGTYVWRPTLTLWDAVALAGGLTTRGTLRGASARRHGRTVRLGRDDPVRAGDQVTIRRRLF